MKVNKSRYYLGVPVTQWIEDDRLKMHEPFAYEDKRGVKWVVPRDFITDGASIPFFLRPVIGHPFAGNTMEAAIIHDYYCVTQSRSQKDTHRVFREICEYSGVSSARAWVMWSGIRSYNRIKNFGWK